MTVDINFIQRKPIRERVWKTLTVVVGISTILNVSMIGTLMAPQVARASEIADVTDNSTTSVSGKDTLPASGNNPAIGQSCGLDIGLLVDTSGSVDKNEMAQMKTALKSFAGAFAGTPTQFSLSQFNTDSSVIQAFTSDASLIQNKIDTTIPSVGTGNTNWDSGLARAASTFDPRPTKANVIVIATDGSPNRYSYPTATPGTSPLDWNGALTHASDRANTIKTSGTRIVVLGIGSDEGDPYVETHGNADAKLQAISGTNMATTVGAITPATDVIKVTDFTGIGAALASYAKSLCGGKILVQKQFDTNGDGVADVDGSSANAVLAGWNFDVNGTASNPVAQVTTSTGSLQFNNILNGSDYSIVETQSAGTKLVSAICKNGSTTVGTFNAATNTISGLTMATDQTISCTFVNAPANGSLKVTKIVDNGTTSADSFAFTINPDPSKVGAIHTTNGQYVFNALAAGKYTVSEATMAGYHQVSSTCSNVQVTAGQQASCVIHNAQDTGVLKVVKHVINDDGGIAMAKDWSLHVKQNGQEVTDSPQAGSENGTVYTLTPGTYTVSETGTTTGYAATVMCDGHATNTVTIGAGNPSICVITNNDVAPTITLKKVVTGSTTADVNSFGISVDGTVVTSGAMTTVKANTPIALDEAGRYGYHFVSITGDTSCPSVLGGKVTLKPGQNMTCTITNSKDDFGVAIVKSAPTTVFPGAQISYNLHWSVNGNVAISNVVVSDPLPSNVTFVTASSGFIYDTTTKTVSWNLGTKNAGQAGDVTITTTVINPLVSGTTIANTGKVCGSANLDTGIAPQLPTQKCATDTKTTTVISDFTVKLTKTGPATVNAGGQLTYTMAWEIGGTSPVTSTLLTDSLPSNTVFVSAANGGTYDATTKMVTWNLGAHVPGDKGSVTLLVSAVNPLANGTIITNIGQICAAAAAIVGQHCEKSTVVTTTSSAPTLIITKTNDIAGFTNPGKQAMYTVTVSNASTATDTAHNVILNDVLPAGFTYVIGGGSTKAFNLGDIAPGKSVVTTYVANIASAQAAGSYTNTATAKGDNTSSVTATSAVAIKLPVVLGVTVTPAMTITKTVDVNLSNPGKTVNYTVTVANSGDADLTNVVVKDTLPSGFVFVDGGKATKTWTIGTLLAHHQRVINYPVKIAETVKAGNYENKAVATSDQLDPKTAKVKVQVKVPQVLGLATTGVSTRDYIVFAIGLSLIMVGGMWINRLRRYNGTTLA